MNRKVFVTALLGAALSIALAAAPAAAKGGNGNGNGAGSAGNGNGNGNGNGGNSGGGNASTAPRACALSDLSPTASACSGFYAGNLLGGSGGMISGQTTGLAAIGFNWDGDFNAVTKINSLNGATTVDFGKMLYGDTFVGFHFGAGAGLGGQATAFYKFDAGSMGIGSFALRILQGSSGAVLYSTGLAPEGPGGGVPAVPEPATWAMLIAGFGMVGMAMRRKRGAVPA